MFSSAPTPPDLFSLTAFAFHVFPLHAPLTLFAFDAPFGKFASKASKLNLNGNLAWAAMEFVAPVTLVTTLLTTPHPPLTPDSQILFSLYLIHYAHRAGLSPLFLSPKRSALHLIVPLAAVVFNLLNAYNIAIGLAFYPPPPSSSRFWLGVLGWAIGFAGNIYHDEILNDLRRPQNERLITSPSDAEEEDKKIGKGRYAIPRGGLFRFVSFPNYLCEWAEWTFYAIAFAPSPLIPLSPASPLARLPFAPTKMLHPAWLFVLAEITSMLPRAIRGHQWYRRTFGARYPAGRKAVFPGIL